MSDLLLERGHKHVQHGPLLVVFNGSPADERALETALELARCTRASLQALMLEDEFRGYSVSVSELERLRAAAHRRVVAHAFLLCDRALEEGLRLPLDLVTGDDRGWLRKWMDGCGFVLAIVGHEHRPFREYLPTSVVSRVRRSASCPIVVVK